ncbi:MAG: pyruvate kinase, partial [Anaerolineales bacterium]
MNRKTKIIATIGPAIAQLPLLSQVFEAGVNVIRINASHGNDEEHLHYIELVRGASIDCGVPIPVMLDLQGPKIRLGELESSPIRLNNGDEIMIMAEPQKGNAHAISINFPELSDYAQPGMRVLIDDGKITLSILHVEPGKILAKVLCGGDLYPHKGVNFPDLEQFLPSFTEQDRHNLALGMQHGIDIIAVSFVRSAQDIIDIRNYINSEFNQDNSIPIIAKIELASGLKNIDQILAVSDGVMVARGDLAVEISAAKVPIAQKQIIEAAN